VKLTELFVDPAHQGNISKNGARQIMLIREEEAGYLVLDLDAEYFF
jgi:hypothetical protein